MNLLKSILFFLGIRQKKRFSVNSLPKITVLIPAYNEEKVIAKTIESVQNQTCPIEEIIVIDDCSSDKTAQIAKSLGAKVVRTPQNTGTKAKALNFGLAFVKTEIVVCLDADTILDKSAIEKLVSFLCSEKISCACGFVLPQRKKNFWELGRLVQYFYCLLICKTAQAHWEVPLVASGCFSAIKMRDLKEIGGYPQGNMAEDMALTWHFLLLGKKVGFVLDALSYPKDPTNWHQYKSQVLRWYRGFLQCITDHKRKLFKNPKLGFFVGYYLLAGILQPFLFGLVFWFFFILWKKNTFWPLVFGSWLGFEALAVIGVVVVGGIRYKCFFKSILGIPCYWLLGPIDSFLFLYSLWKEWIKKERLKSWEKGH